MFKLDHQMQVSIVAGLPSVCLEEILSNRPDSSELNCHNDKLDAKLFSYCGEDILFGSITISPDGALYMSDISRQSANRVFRLAPDGTLVNVAGLRTNSTQHALNCSVERCFDISGHNCTCLISDVSPKEQTSSEVCELLD